jgi:hypothetical protein
VLSTPLPGINPKSQPKGDWVMLLIRKAWYGLVAGKRLAERRWVLLTHTGGLVAVKSNWSRLKHAVGY